MATFAEYWQRGEALDYVNETDEVINANTVIQVGSIIGVTGTVIPPNKMGSLHVTGVWKIPKSSTDAIEMGQVVYWDGTGITGSASSSSDSTESDTETTEETTTDETTEETTESSESIEVGIAAAAAAADDTVVLVRLRG